MKFDIAAKIAATKPVKLPEKPAGLLPPRRIAGADVPATPCRHTATSAYGLPLVRGVPTFFCAEAAGYQAWAY